MDNWDEAYTNLFSKEQEDLEDKASAFIAGCMIGRYMAQIQLCDIFDSANKECMDIGELLVEFAERSSEELKKGCLPEESIVELHKACEELSQLKQWLDLKDERGI